MNIRRKIFFREKRDANGIIGARARLRADQATNVARLVRARKIQFKYGVLYLNEGPGDTTASLLQVANELTASYFVSHFPRRIAVVQRIGEPLY